LSRELRFFASLLGFALLTGSACRERSASSDSAPLELSEECDTFTPQALSDEPGKVGRGTRILNESLGDPVAFKRFFVLALGVFLREEYGHTGSLERFGRKVSAAIGRPAVSHWAFTTAHLAREGELPVGIRPGSPADLTYEARFGRIIDRALERYFCDKHPVLFFNLTGVDPEVTNTLTSRELRQIFLEPRYRRRTQFYVDDKPVSEDVVRRKYSL
jgi:hypothetical protein